MGATSESSWSGGIFIGGAWAFGGADGLCAWNDGSSARVSPGTIATTQMTAIKRQNLVANVSRNGLMTHFPSERKVAVIREPIPGKEKTKLGKPLRLHALNADQ